MSIHVLPAWAKQDDPVPPRGVIHTYLDDLESFFWVLLYTTLQSLKPVNREIWLLKAIESDDLEIVATSKTAFLSSLDNPNGRASFFEDYPNIANTASHLPILQWGSAIRALFSLFADLEVNEKAQECLQKIIAITKSAYAFFILSGWQHVNQNVRWDELRRGL